MIAYFDTSAIVPLEARAALAQAVRLGRIDTRQHTMAKGRLDMVLAQLDLVDIDDDLVGRAAELAEQQALRAYDAVHLAAAQRASDQDLVVVAADRDLLGAAAALGITTAVIG